MLEQNYTILQGETWERFVIWEKPEWVYKPITGITKGAPARITAPAHGLVDNWRFVIADVQGMTEINTAVALPSDEDRFWIATKVDTDNIDINDLNSLSYGAYSSGGVIRYHPTVPNLEDYVARMQFRKSAKDPTVLFELTSENGRIILADSTQMIKLSIPASETEQFAFTKAVYDLEMVGPSPSEDVHIIARGSIAVSKNITHE